MRYVKYKVKKGDTLSQIASTFNIGMTDIELANKIQNRDFIKEGDLLYIPQHGKIDAPEKMFSYSDLSIGDWVLAIDMYIYDDLQEQNKMYSMYEISNEAYQILDIYSDFDGNVKYVLKEKYDNNTLIKKQEEILYVLKQEEDLTIEIDKYVQVKKLNLYNVKKEMRKLSSKIAKISDLRPFYEVTLQWSTDTWPPYLFEHSYEKIKLTNEKIKKPVLIEDNIYESILREI